MYTELSKGKFTMPQEEFDKRLNEDPDYQKRVYSILKEVSGGKFTLSEDEFSTRVTTGSPAVKKKEESVGAGQSTTSTTPTETNLMDAKPMESLQEKSVKEFNLSNTPPSPIKNTRAAEVRNQQYYDVANRGSFEIPLPGEQKDVLIEKIKESAQADREMQREIATSVGARLNAMETNPDEVAEVEKRYEDLQQARKGLGGGMGMMAIPVAFQKEFDAVQKKYKELQDLKEIKAKQLFYTSRASEGKGPIEIYEEYLEESNPGKLQSYKTRETRSDDYLNQQAAANHETEAINFASDAIQSKYSQLESAIGYEQLKTLRSLSGEVQSKFDQLQNLDSQYRASSDPEEKNQIAKRFEELRSDPEFIEKTKALEEIQQNPLIQELNNTTAEYQQLYQQTKDMAEKYPAVQEMVEAKIFEQSAFDAKYRNSSYFRQLAMDFESAGKRVMGKVIKDLMTLPRTLSQDNNWGWTDNLAESVNTYVDLYENFGATQPTAHQRGLAEDVVNYKGFQVVVDKDNKATAVRDKNGYRLGPFMEQSLTKEFNKVSDQYTPEKQINYSTIFPKFLKLSGDMGVMFLGAGKGTMAMKGIGLGKKASETIGLTSAVVAQTHNDAYEQALENGLSPSEASKYALAVSGSISLIAQINPQTYVFSPGAAKKSAARFAEVFFKGKKGMSQTKEAARHVFKESLKEAVEETAEIPAEAAIGAAANLLTGGRSTFDTDIDWNEYIESFALGFAGGGAFSPIGIRRTSDMQREALNFAVFNAREFDEAIDNSIGKTSLINGEKTEITPQIAQTFKEDLNRLRQRVASVTSLKKFNDVEKSHIVDIEREKMSLNRMLSDNPEMSEAVKKIHKARINLLEEKLNELIGKENTEPTYEVGGDLLKKEDLESLKSDPEFINKLSKGNVNFRIINDPEAAEDLMRIAEGKLSPEEQNLSEVYEKEQLKQQAVKDKDQETAEMFDQEIELLKTNPRDYWKERVELIDKKTDPEEYQVAQNQLEYFDALKVDEKPKVEKPTEPEKPKQKPVKKEKPSVEPEKPIETPQDPAGEKVLKTKKGKEPNENGVYEPEERIMLKNPKKDWKGGPLAEIGLVELEDGKFRASVDINTSTSGVASPITESSGSFDTREEAIIDQAQRVKAWAENNSGKETESILKWADQVLEENKPAEPKKDKPIEKPTAKKEPVKQETALDEMHAKNKKDWQQKLKNALDPKLNEFAKTLKGKSLEEIEQFRNKNVKKLDKEKATELHNYQMARVNQEVREDAENRNPEYLKPSEWKVKINGKDAEVKYVFDYFTNVHQLSVNSKDKAANIGSGWLQGFLPEIEGEETMENLITQYIQSQLGGKNIKVEFESSAAADSEKKQTTEDSGKAKPKPELKKPAAKKPVKKQSTKKKVSSFEPTMAQQKAQVLSQLEPIATMLPTLEEMKEKESRYGNEDEQLFNESLSDEFWDIMEKSGLLEDSIDVAKEKGADAKIRMNFGGESEARFPIRNIASIIKDVKRNYPTDSAGPRIGRPLTSRGAHKSTWGVVTQKYDEKTGKTTLRPLSKIMDEFEQRITEMDENIKIAKAEKQTPDVKRMIETFKKEKELLEQASYNTEINYKRDERNAEYRNQIIDEGFNPSEQFVDYSALHDQIKYRGKSLREVLEDWKVPKLKSNEKSTKKGQPKKKSGSLKDKASNASASAESARTQRQVESAIQDVVSVLDEVELEIEKLSEEDTKEYTDRQKLGHDAVIGSEPKTKKRVPVDPIYDETPGTIKLDDIFKNFADKLKKAPLLVKGFTRRSSAAQYRPYSGGVQLGARSLGSFAHEMGHYLDDKYSIFPDLPEKGTPVYKELKKLWPHGSKPPAEASPDFKFKYRVAEGIAEYFRALIVNPEETKKRFPELTKLVESKLPTEVMEASMEFSREYRTFAGYPGTSRIRSSREIVEPKKGLIQHFYNPDIFGDGVLVSFRDMMATQLLDSTYSSNEMYKSALKEVGLDPKKIKPEENFLYLSRNYLGIDGKQNNFAINGIEYPEWSGKPMDQRFILDKGQKMNLRWLMEPYDNTDSETMREELNYAMDVMIAKRTIEIPKKLLRHQVKEDLQELLKTGKLPPQDILDIVPDLVDKFEEDIEKLEEKYKMAGVDPKMIPRYKMSRYDFTGEHLTGITHDRREETDFEVAKRAVAEFKQLREQDPEKFKRIQEGGRRYRLLADTLMKYMYWSGRISKAALEEIQISNQHYVSLSRSMDITPGVEATTIEKTGNGKIGIKQQPFFTVKGSSRRIKEPLASLLENMDRIIKESDRNVAMQAFVKPLTMYRNMHEGEVKELDQYGQEIDKEDNNSITIFIDGKPTYWVFHPDVKKALEGVTIPDQWIEKVLQFPAKLLRWTVTHWPKFGVHNFTRDVVHRVVVSRTGSDFKDLATTKEEWDLWKSAGGSQAGYYMKDRKNYNKMVSRAIKETVNENKKIMFMDANKFNYLISGKWYMDFIQGAESVNRVAEFKSAFRKAKKDGMDDYNASIYASFESRDLLDFAVAGTFMKRFNKYAPFTNAGIRGVHRTYQKFSEGGVAGFAEAMTLWSLYVLAPSATLRLMVHMMGEDDEYKNLPAYQKDLFYNIPFGEGYFVAIPKPFELGVMASGADRLMDMYYGNEWAFEGYAGSIARAFIPFEESILAGPYKTMLEVNLNQDIWRDKMIIPYTEEKLKLSKRKYKANGSRLSQAISGESMDPRKVDYFIQNTMSYFGDFALKLSDIGREDNRNQFSVADLPYFKRASAYSAPNVQWIMKTGKEEGWENTSEYRDFSRYLSFSMTISDPKERNKVRKNLLKIAEQIRENWQKKIELQKK